MFFFPLLQMCLLIDVVSTSFLYVIASKKVTITSQTLMSSFVTQALKKKKSKGDYKKIPPFLNLNCEKNFNFSNFTSKWEHIHRIPPSQHPSIYIVFVLWPQKTIYFLLVPLTIPLLHSFLFYPLRTLPPWQIVAIVFAHSKVWTALFLFFVFSLYPLFSSFTF